MENALKSNERQRIWVWKTLKIEILKGWPNDSDILQNWFSPEIMSPIFYLQKFQDSEKSTLASCRMHWNLMNEKDALKSNEWERIWIHKSFKIEIQNGPASNSDILQNWFPEKLGLTFLIWRNSKSLRKLLLSQVEYIQI